MEDIKWNETAEPWKIPTEAFGTSHNGRIDVASVCERKGPALKAIL
jgi:hypothetical protein